MKHLVYIAIALVTLLSCSSIPEVNPLNITETGYTKDRQNRVYLYSYDNSLNYNKTQLEEILTAWHKTHGMHTEGKSKESYFFLESAPDYHSDKLTNVYRIIEDYPVKFSFKIYTRHDGVTGSVAM